MRYTINPRKGKYVKEEIRECGITLCHSVFEKGDRLSCDKFVFWLSYPNAPFKYAMAELLPRVACPDKSPEDVLDEWSSYEASQREDIDPKKVDLLFRVQAMSKRLSDPAQPQSNEYANNILAMCGGMAGFVAGGMALFDLDDMHALVVVERGMPSMLLAGWIQNWLKSMGRGHVVFDIYPESSVRYFFES
jgi:hypothetical protein